MSSSGVEQYPVNWSHDVSCCMCIVIETHLFMQRDMARGRPRGDSVPTNKLKGGKHLFVWKGSSEERLMTLERLTLIASGD